jgi:hypothetical protein
MATLHDLVIDQGSRFQVVIKVTVDWLATLAGYQVRAYVRASQTLDGPVLVDLSSYLTITDPTQGLITMDVPANVTTAWDWSHGHYDMEIFDGNAAHDVRVLQGEIRVDKEVTHT